MGYRTSKKGEKLHKIQKKREHLVYKSNEMVQRARYNLTMQEMRIIHFALSQLNPKDELFTEYTIDLNELYDLCGIENESYTAFKKIVKDLSDKSWWVSYINKDTGAIHETLVRWFDVIDITNKSKITLVFHRLMMPYLLELFKQYEKYGIYYVKYKFNYILPMKRKYSIRLYELLKSYSNNDQWEFKTDWLRHILDSNQYQDFYDFRRRVLEPAVKEINDYTDLIVSYEAHKEGKKVATVTFYIREKSIIENWHANHNTLTKLEGNIHYWDKDTK